jgi:phosphatidate cytidylyltransferase
LSGIALAALALVDIWLGGYWLAALAALAAVLMLWEHHRMVTGDRRFAAPALLALGISGAGAVLASTLSGLGAGFACVAAGAVVVASTAQPQARPWLVGGLVYMALAMCFVTMLRGEAHWGFSVVLWLVLVVVAADVGAYFVGRSVGGRRLWPAVSPGKTWSGAFGGLGLAVAVGLLYGHLGQWSPLRTGLLSAGVAVASQAGDLLESAVKRRFMVKDTSSLIPGHGGLMDRLDGVMGALWFFAIYDLLGGGTMAADFGR